MNLEKGYNKDRGVMVEKAALEMMYNPEVKLGLADLDNFEGEMLLSDQRKIDILGCVIGVKPAAIAKGWLETKDLGSDRSLGKEVELGEIITRLGLRWSMEIRPVESKLEVDLFVARDKETLEQLKAANRQSPKELRKLAKLQGYPEAGAEVMLGLREGLSETTRVDLTKEDVAYTSFFAPPILSRKDYRQEIKDYSRILISSARVNLPKTYEKAMKRWDTIRNG